MMTFMRVALISGLMATPLGAMAQDRVVPSISVSGEGIVTAPADMAVVTVGVMHEGKTTGEVLDAVSMATTGILAVLEAAAIPQGDIQTGRVSLIPRYGRTVLGAPDYTQIEGYTASTTLSVTTHDLTTLGGLLSDVVAGGANTVNGVSFGIDDDSALMDEARAKAVEDARHRAEVYAMAAGVDLGGVLTLSENSYGGYAPVVMEAMSARSFDSGAPKMDVPLVAGDITVSAQVSIVYGIATE